MEIIAEVMLCHGSDIQIMPDSPAKGTDTVHTVLNDLFGKVGKERRITASVKKIFRILLALVLVLVIAVGGLLGWLSAVEYKPVQVEAEIGRAHV